MEDFREEQSMGGEELPDKFNKLTARRITISLKVLEVIREQVRNKC